MSSLHRLAAGPLVALFVAMSSRAHIHGMIVSIDKSRGTFLIHHDPFEQMPMAMTMEAQPKNPADLKRLQVGEVIDATIDTSIDPWPATEIRRSHANPKPPTKR